ELGDLGRRPVAPATRSPHPTGVPHVRSPPRPALSRSPSMISLEARDVVVEVGGTIVVEGLSFDLRAGDKIGVVGRNGAGKTSTMKVLAGEEEPRGGSIVRRGSVGYLRQDPR